MIFETLIAFLLQPNTFTVSNPPQTEFVALVPNRNPFIQIAEARDYPPYAPEWTELAVERLIRDKARKYGVDPEKSLAVAKCESKLKYDIQSFHVKDGVREDSWGVWQLNLYWNPDVTKEQAIDPVWATEWAMERLSEGKWYLWTCSKITGVISP